MALSPAQRSARARFASYASWARTEDRRARTAAATAASPVSLDYWLAKFSHERPDLSPADRRRRAEAAWKAHQGRMALKASQAAARRRADRKAAS
jgi:hypothetical protein